MGYLVKEDSILVKIIVYNIIITAAVYLFVYTFFYYFKIIDYYDMDMLREKGVIHDFFYLQLILFPFNKLNYLRKNVNYEQSFLLNFKYTSVLKKIAVTIIHIISIIILNRLIFKR